MALNYDSVAAIARESYIPKLADNVMTSSFLFQDLKANPDTFQGGTKIIQPLRYARHRGGSYAEWDLMDVRPKETRTAAVFDWKHIYANISISKQQELEVSGKEAVLNLLQVETEGAEETLIDLCSTSAFNDGTNTVDPHGLRKIVAIDRSLGGIDSTTYTWWDAVTAAAVDSDYTTTNLTETNLTNPSSPYFILKVMRRIWNRCTNNNKQPDTTYMSEGMFNVYEAVLQPYAVYNREPTGRIKMAADGGFQVLEYKGEPVLLEKYCPAGFFFFIRSEYLNMYLHEKDSFNMGDFQKPVNQQAMIAQVTVTMQFGTSNARYLGIVQGASAIG